MTNTKRKHYIFSDVLGIIAGPFKSRENAQQRIGRMIRASHRSRRLEPTQPMVLSVVVRNKPASQRRRGQ
jgi:superfamily II DNA or RNA helicase